jgi:hypothetical protein
MQHKKIGNSKENIEVMATDFSGSQIIKITTPKNPSNEIKEEVRDYILGELDDHDAWDEYKKIAGDINYDKR